MKRVVILSLMFLLNGLLFCGTHELSKNKVSFTITSSFNEPFYPKENVLWFSNTNISHVVAYAYSNTYPVVTLRLDLNKKNLISQFSCTASSDSIKKGFINYLEKNLGNHGCSQDDIKNIKKTIFKKLFPASPLIDRRLK
ncbi:MAG: hypothetical protein ACOYT8_01640 [Candidatus Dependentiae bacterium]